jgi:hypothetical protein
MDLKWISGTLELYITDGGKATFCQVRWSKLQKCTITIVPVHERCFHTEWGDTYFYIYCAQVFV